MNFDKEKLFAKISGENVEGFVKCVINDTSKAQIDFAFNQMFQGLSLLQWMQNVTLAEAWRSALDNMLSFVFSLPDKNYVIDYLHNAVFDFRKNTLKTMGASIHSNEYFKCPPQNQIELETEAKEKIKQGRDIIMNLVSNPDTCYVEKREFTNTMPVQQKTKEREQEYERERK